MTDLTALKQAADRRDAELIKLGMAIWKLKEAKEVTK